MLRARDAGSLTRTVSRQMEPDPYIPLMKALAGVGLIGQRNLPDQLIVSTQQGPVWPNRGNSFLLSHREGVWYLSTWLPVHYHVCALTAVVRRRVSFVRSA